LPPARTRSTAGCRAARCRMEIPCRVGSPGCRTAAGSRLARTAFTGLGHRVRQAEQRAGTPRRRHHHIPSPRTRTRSAAAGDGRPRLPLRRPVGPGRPAQSQAGQLRVARVLAGPRKVRRDLRLGRGPQGFLGPPASQRHASTPACRAPALTPPTAASGSDRIGTRRRRDRTGRRDPEHQDPTGRRDQTASPEDKASPARTGPRDRTEHLGRTVDRGDPEDLGRMVDRGDLGHLGRMVDRAVR
jgi:hypothetical protein